MKLYWQPRRLFVTSFRPTRNWQKEKTLQPTWHPSQRQQNLFFPSDYPLHYFQAIIFGVWSMFGSKYDPRAAKTQRGSLKACWKPFGQNLSDGMTSRKRNLAAEY